MNEKLYQEYKQILNIFKMIFGNKKVQIIEFLVKNQDEDNYIYKSIDEICKKTNSSKPTVINCLKELQKYNIVKKIKNKTYELSIKDFHDI